MGNLKDNNSFVCLNVCGMVLGYIVQKLLSLKVSQEDFKKKKRVAYP
jgi:glycopeptide antibiotics resistance protein